VGRLEEPWNIHSASKVVFICVDVSIVMLEEKRRSRKGEMQ
jgi:hypothetical protein